jgi:hypothetical protein
MVVMTVLPSRAKPLRQRVLQSALVLIALAAMAGGAPLASAAATISPKQSVLLTGTSVGRVSFGEAQQQAVTALKGLIGATQGGVRDARGNCTIDAALYWANFSVYFLGGRFVGYQTGNNLTGRLVPTFNGRTPGGLRVGDTLARARQLYPGRVTTSGVNGGVYAIRTPRGTIRGYLSVEVSNPPAKIRVVTISAGSVGCPADSPG